MWSYTYTDELYHHGILGQKWGVRRYQNTDGSYTEAGKKRYKIDESGKIWNKTKYASDQIDALNRADSKYIQAKSTGNGIDAIQYKKLKDEIKTDLSNKNINVGEISVLREKNPNIKKYVGIGMGATGAVIGGLLGVAASVGNPLGMVLGGVAGASVGGSLYGAPAYYGAKMVQRLFRGEAEGTGYYVDE